MNKEILELAIKYGVPMHDTCKSLAWKMPTNYIWALHPINGHELHFVMQETATGFKTAVCGLHSTDFVERDRAIFAPQMHEIAVYVPDTLQNGHQHLLCFDCYDEDIKELVLMYGVSALNAEDIPFLFWSEDYEPFETTVNLNHYVQAYAELYLKLREAGLLENEVKTEN